MNVSSEILAGHGLVLLLRSAIVLAVGLLAAFAMKSKGPAWTTLIFRATLATAFVGVAAAAMFQPSVHPMVSVSAPASGPSFSWPAKQANVRTKPSGSPAFSDSTTNGVVSVGDAAPRFAEAPFVPEKPAGETSSVSVRDGVLALWLTGCAVLLCWIAVGQLWLWNWRRAANGTDAIEAKSILDRVAARQGVRSPNLVVLAGAKSPFLAGILRPTIFIPASMTSEFEEAQVEAIFSHELIHMKHRDCLWNLVALLMCALAWPNPMSWVISRQLRLASEELCDQAVIQLGLQPKSYAQCLLKVAELRAVSRTERLVGVGVIEFKSTLARRVELVLGGRTLARIGRVARVATASALTVVAGVTCLLVSAHRPTAASAKSSSIAQAALPATDPAAREFINQCVEAYKNLSSYSARGTSMLGDFQSTTYDVELRRPDQVFVRLYQQNKLAVAAQIYGEKDRFYVTSPEHPHTYVVHERPPVSSSNPYGRYPWYGDRSTLAVALQSAFLETGVAETLLGDAPDRERLSLDHSQSITFGTAENPADKLILLQSSAQVGQTQITALEINVSDHLIRKETDTFKSPHADDYVQRQIYSDVKVNPTLKALPMNPPSDWKRIVAHDGPPERSKASQELTSELVNTLKNAHSISFVDDETETQQRKDANGLLQTHQQHMRMTCAIEKPLKAHIKLTLDEYPTQGLELFADGQNLYVLKGTGARTYLKLPATGDDISHMGNVGVPVNACTTALDALEAALPSHIGGMFNGDRGKPTELQGMPVDRLIRNDSRQDRYGFPAKGGGERVILLSQKDHTIRQVMDKIGDGPSGTTIIENFSDFHLDVPIPDSEFQFDPSGRTPVENTRDIEPHRPAIGLNLQPGDFPPDFHSTDLSGKPISLDQFRGKVVLLFGWTMGIGNYQWDLPHFQKLQDMYGKKGLVVIGIPFDQRSDMPDMLKFLRSHKITVPEVFDGLGRKAGIQKLYKTYETMFNYVITRDGRLYAKDSWDKDIDKAVTEALAK